VSAVKIEMGVAPSGARKLCLKLGGLRHWFSKAETERLAGELLGMVNHANWGDDPPATRPPPKPRKKRTR